MPAPHYPPLHVLYLIFTSRQHHRQDPGSHGLINRDAVTTAAPSALLAAGTPLEPGKHRPPRTAGEYSSAIGRQRLGKHPDGHWLAPRPRSARLTPGHAKEIAPASLV